MHTGILWAQRTLTDFSFGWRDAARPLARWTKRRQLPYCCRDDPFLFDSAGQLYGRTIGTQ
jgi:hypothetical protein